MTRSLVVVLVGKAANSRHLLKLPTRAAAAQILKNNQ